MIGILPKEGIGSEAVHNRQSAATLRLRSLLVPSSIVEYSQASSRHPQGILKAYIVCLSECLIEACLGKRKSN